MTTPTTGRPALFDLSARLWLHAYPRRWRATYGPDLLGMLADVAPERARTVPVREGLAVLRAGWALRWREHPGFWAWLGYRWLGRRLPGRYRCWVIDDLLGPLYEVRTMLPIYVLAAVISVGGPIWMFGESSAPPPWAPAFLLAWFAFLILVAMVFKHAARYVWAKHIGGNYPTALLPLWRRIAVRRAARNGS